MNLGKIIGVSKSNHIIIRSTDWKSIKNHPSIGDNVFNIEKEKIGRIHDIFGPVIKPYISIILYNSDENALNSYKEKKGEFLYTFQDPRRSKRTKRPKTTKKHVKKKNFKRISPK